ncbi:unnamed protein product [Fusarium graminearum]|nr:unnamed protein product [Fusarium graminearum]
MPMDESTILAMSVARAVEADAALIEELRQEDQIARDRMIAETLETDPEAIIEPYQSAIDEETFETLRQFNVIATSNAGETDSGEERTTDGTQNDQQAQQIQLAANTDEIQDTVVDLEDGAQRVNPVEDPLCTTTADKPAKEQQETDVPGKARIQEQERDTAQNVLTVVEESAARAQPTNIAPVPDKQCVSCQDDFPATETFEAPCSHHWCRRCLIIRIEASLRDESLFPPTCCEPLPVEVGDFISQEMVDLYQEKTLEFSTIDRTYCSDATCAAFIPPQSIEGDLGRCSGCEKQTCVLCKRASHEGICPEDNAAQDVLRLGEAEGWQRCEKCKHLIDLNTGCFHISEYIFQQPSDSSLTNIAQPALAVINFATSVETFGRPARAPNGKKTDLSMPLASVL